ncbi:hypothetical protein M1271_01240 [Patescibacteria group bacterium]|nr:hypothetical protein [Patescibacteria group bacterium]
MNAEIARPLYVTGFSLPDRLPPTTGELPDPSPMEIHPVYDAHLLMETAQKYLPDVLNLFDRFNQKTRNIIQTLKTNLQPADIKHAAESALLAGLVLLTACNPGNNNTPSIPTPIVKEMEPLDWIDGITTQCKQFLKGALANLDRVDEIPNDAPSKGTSFPNPSLELVRIGNTAMRAIEVLPKFKPPENPSQTIGGDVVFYYFVPETPYDDITVDSAADGLIPIKPSDSGKRVCIMFGEDQSSEHGGNILITKIAPPKGTKMPDIKHK